MATMNCEEFTHNFTYKTGQDDEDKTGPAHWADYCPDCGKSQQSPIDIVTAATFNHDTPLALDYSTAPPLTEITNNGHTIYVPYTVGRLEYGGITYQSQQYHFHAPSEHTIDKGYFDIEVHVVHESDKSEVAVLGFMINARETGWPAMDQLFAQFTQVPHKGDTANTPGAYVSSLFPTDSKCYLYHGSFTDPCTQGVRWFLLAEPSYISQSLYDQITKIMSGNNRPLQPLTGRAVTVTNQVRVGR